MDIFFRSREKRKAARLARERKTVAAMLRIFCRAHHGGGKDLCAACADLQAYVMCRLDRCPFGAEKPTCAACPIHCYKTDRREQIRAVMRYAGPRMLWHHAQRQPYGIKTTEAPQYRRFVLRRQGDPQQSPGGTGASGHQRAPLGINDGRGVMFVSHRGVIYPSGFLPVVCGQFPRDSVVDVYQHHPSFQALRDANRLEGKCGRCEFRHVCGGSRARSFAVTGDMLAAEPDCPYLPSASRNGTTAATCAPQRRFPSCWKRAPCATRTTSRPNRARRSAAVLSAEDRMS